jgi:hypothetical protein
MTAAAGQNLVLELVLTSAHLTERMREEAGLKPSFSPQMDVSQQSFKNR